MGHIEGYLKVKLIFFLSKSLNFGPPPRGAAAAWARYPLSNVLQNRACVTAMKKSPKGEILHINHHDNVI